MTDRTFRQYALGFGSTPSQVVFQIDGNQVFNGSVTTLDEPMPYLPNAEYTVDNIAWSWQHDASFSGTQSISISVTGSPLLFAATLANNPSGNADVYSTFYSVEIDGVEYTDPMTDEAIDGVALAGPYQPEFPGQWWWNIPVGSTFTATMNVTGIPPTQPDPA